MPKCSHCHVLWPMDPVGALHVSDVMMVGMSETGK
jgi:hypothetical protein